MSAVQHYTVSSMCDRRYGCAGLSTCTLALKSGRSVMVKQTHFMREVVDRHENTELVCYIKQIGSGTRCLV